MTMRGGKYWLGTLVVVALFAEEPLASARDAAPKLSAARADGVYSSAANTIRILALGNGKLRVDFYTQSAGPAPDTGEARGDATLQGNVATYTSSDYGRCLITLTFLPKDELRAETSSQASDCGFGYRAHADGKYKRDYAGVPVFPPAEFTGPIPHLVATPNKLGATTAADLKTLCDVAALDHSDALESSKLAAGAEKASAVLAAEPKTALDALKAERAEFDKHQRAGATAYQAYKSGVHAGKATSTALDKLQTASTEYEIATRLGQALLVHTEALRAKEADLVKQLSIALDAALEADRSAKDAAKLSAQAKAIATLFEKASLKGDTAHAASTASTLAKQAKDDADAAIAAGKATALSTKQVVKAVGATTLNAAAQLATRAGNADDATFAAVDKTRRTFEQLGLVRRNPGAAPPVCEIRKVDWANRTYTGSLTLRGGSLDEANGGMGDHWSLRDVAYGDTDKNGITEAFVPIFYSNGAPLGDSATTYVFELDGACQPRLLGQITGVGAFSQGEYAVDTVFVQDGDMTCCPSGKSRAKYKVRRGAVR